MNSNKKFMRDIISKNKSFLCVFAFFCTLALVSGCDFESSTHQNEENQYIIKQNSSLSENSVGMWVLMLWFNDNNYTPWDSYVRMSPLFGQYFSDNIEFIDYTLQNADSMGIDYLILDNTNGVFRHEGKFDDIIKLYIERIKYLEVDIKISIAIGYSLFQMRDLELFNESVEHISRYFSDRTYYKADDKPLLILYVNPDSQITSISSDEDYFQLVDSNDRFGYRNLLKEQNISVRYMSGSDQWIDDKFGVYGWKYEYPQKVGDTMGVMPGWNRSHNELTGSTPNERAEGKYYIDSWERVLNHNPSNVVIVSWDDWAEETAIADEDGWGSLYTDITTEMIKRYKGSN